MRIGTACPTSSRQAAARVTQGADGRSLTSGGSGSSSLSGACDILGTRASVAMLCRFVRTAPVRAPQPGYAWRKVGGEGSRQISRKRAWGVSYASELSRASVSRVIRATTQPLPPPGCHDHHGIDSASISHAGAASGTGTQKNIPSSRKILPLSSAANQPRGNITSRQSLVEDRARETPASSGGSHAPCSGGSNGERYDG